MSRSREVTVKLWRKQRYLREMASLSWRYRDIQEDVEHLLKYDTLKSRAHWGKEALRTTTPSWQQVLRGKVREAIDSFLDTGPKTRRSLEWSYGKHPKLGKKFTHSNATSFALEIGHMWYFRVWKPIFEGKTSLIPDKYFILAAEKVRVNNDLMDVFEVSIADRTVVTMESPTQPIGWCPKTTAYVAVTKKSRKACFGLMAHTAIATAKREIEAEIDAAIMKGNANDADS